MCWPRERWGHASAIIQSNPQCTEMVVIGGNPAYDSFIYINDNNTWQQVITKLLY